MQQRLEYLDTAKGIGIFLVVIGHCISGKTLPGMYITSFHMPLFFLISGMCFNAARYPRFAPFFKKRAQTLLLPLLYFTAIVLALSAIALPSYYDITQLTRKFPNAYWFVFVLFLSELLFYAANKWLKSQTLKWAFIAACWGGSAMLMAADIHLPYNISSVCIATFFYGLGYMLKDKFNLMLTNVNGGVFLASPLARSLGRYRW